MSDCNPPVEVRSFFLDISKAFDKVWYQGYLYKLRSMGISEEIYVLENYLSGRFQRVILNGQTFRGDQFTRCTSMTYSTRPFLPLLRIKMKVPILSAMIEISK